MKKILRVLSFVAASIAFTFAAQFSFAQTYPAPTVAYAIFNAVAISSLPSCTSATAGSKAYVSNALQSLAVNFGAVLSGTGSNTIPVGCDGLNWRVGG